MRRASVTVLALGILTLVACGGGAGPPGPVAPGGDILIASDLPITDISPDALAAEGAIRLAISEHPYIGKFRLAYWSLDDAVAGATYPDKGLQNVGMAVDEPRVVGIVGSWASSVSEVEIPLANGHDLVMISPANTRTCLTVASPACAYQSDSLRPAGINNYFRIAPPDPVQGLAMARYVAHNLGVRKVAVINEWGDDGADIIRSFATELSRDGGEIVASEDVDGGTTNFTTFLKAAHDAGAQAIYAVGDATNGDQICVARSQITDGALFLGTDGIARDQECLAQAHGAAMLSTSPDVDITASKDPQAIKEVKAFKNANKRLAITDYTFAAYDSARILISAIQAAVDANGGLRPTRRQVLDAMASIHYHGLTGDYSFDKNGDAIYPLMSVYDVENGQWAYIDKIDAGATPAAGLASIDA